MNKFTQQHTTLVVILTDGSHRTTNWYSAVSYVDITRSLKDTVRFLAADVAVVGAFLASGQQSMILSAESINARVQS